MYTIVIVSNTFSLTFAKLLEMRSFFMEYTLGTMNSRIKPMESPHVYLPNHNNAKSERKNDTVAIRSKAKASLTSLVESRREVTSFSISRPSFRLT